MDRFEWDAGKNRRNQAKHGIAFEVAALVFDDPAAIVETNRIDPATGEQRWQAIGIAMEGAPILLVVHVYRGKDNEEKIRIISARRANNDERRRYQKKGDR